MAHAFRRRHEHYVGRLDAEERGILASLMEQVLGLVAPDRSDTEVDEFEEMLRVAGLAHLDQDSATPPSYDDLDAPDRDPALDRLIPDAHRQDPLIAAEFRRMSAPGLRERKADNLRAAIASLHRAGGGRRGDEIRLNEQEAQAFVVALTDVRLVVGERLSLRTDADADRLELALAAGALNAEETWLVSVYDFLTWLQEGLAEALLGGLDSGGGGTTRDR